jgi:hypothetical protein
MTRLDSDDLIASDFFARLKAVRCDDGEAEKGLVVSFPGGCNYLASENTFYYSAYPDNPFISLIEDIDDAAEARTVYWRMHTEMFRAGFHSHFVRSFYPMWASVLHGATTQNQSLSKTNQVQLCCSNALIRRFGLGR